MNKKHVILIVIILSTLAACRWWDTLMKAGEAVPVTVEKAKESDRVETISTPSTFQVGQKAEVTVAESAPLDRIFVQEGETVTSGQPLFRLEEESILLKLGQLRAEQRENETEYDQIEYLYRNRDRLLDEGEIDNERYDALEGEFKEKEGGAEKISLQIKELEAKRDKVLYRSPISGVVEKVTNTPPGSTVSTAKPVVVVIETNPMIATFALTPEEAAAIIPGMPVVFELLALAGEKVGGTIKSVGSSPDPTTGLFEIKCIVPNDNGVIKTGMTAKAELTSKLKRRFFIVPKEAMLNDGRRHYVYIVEKGIAHQRLVRLHRYIEDQAEISSGLSNNDLVVIKGNDKLKEGTVVELWGRK